MTKIPLILLPGVLSNERVWQHQILHLSDIAEIKVADFSRAASPTAMVDAVLQLGLKHFALAGHSMGGWVAQEVMRQAPEKVTKLCLLNTSARVDAPEKIKGRQRFLQLTNEGQFTQVAEEIVNHFVFVKTEQKAALDMFITTGERAFINNQNAMLIRTSCLPVLPTILCPTLVIHARQDQVFNFEINQELAKNIPQAKFAIIEDCGHMSPMESPQAVTTLLRYWLNYF